MPSLTLRSKLLVGPAVIVLVIGVLAGYAAISLDIQTDNASVVGLVGRQRMLIERLAKEHLLASEGFETGYNETARVLDESFTALLDGGTIRTEVGSSGLTRIDALPPGLARDLIALASARSSDHLNEMNQIMNSDRSEDDAEIATLAALTRFDEGGTTNLLDSAVVELGKNSETALFRIEWVFLSLMSLLAGVTVVGGWFLVRAIGRPVRQVSLQARQLAATLRPKQAQPVAIDRDEVQQLLRSFDAVEVAAMAYRTERDEAEEVFRELFENAPVGYHAIDVRGRFTRVNNTELEMLGYTEAEIVGKPIWNYLQGDEEIESEFLDVVGGLSPVPVDATERELIRKNGQIIDVLIETRAMRDDAGNITGFRESIIDISVIKRAGRVMVESEERYRTLFDRAPVGYQEVDGSGTIVDVNTTELEMLGYEFDEMIGHNFEEFLPAGSRSGKAILDFISDRTPTLDVHEAAIVASDGSALPVTLEATRLDGEDGEMRGARITVQDDRSRRKLETDLRLRSAAMSAAGNGIVITDTDGVIQWVNEAFTSITGFGFNEAVGHTHKILKSGQYDDAFYRSLWETIRAGKVYRNVLVNKRKDGSLYPDEQTITPVHNDFGEITNFIAIKQDVTEKNRLQEQLLQAQKMEAVGQLGGGVAHDFNNILTAIMGFAELTRIKLTQEGSKALDDLSQIQKAAERAAELTRQLLAFSRRSVVRPQAIQIDSLLTTMDRMLRRVIGEHIEIAYLLEGDDLSVMIDPVQVQQVVTNMVINAADAMPDSGKLTIATRAIVVEEGASNDYLGMQSCNYLSMVFTDTGTGIPSDSLSHIFEPFFTTKEQGKGTGLGLATCYGVVAEAKGKILVESVVGEGTRFEVLLPITQETAKSKQGYSDTTENLTGTETILLVEDEPAVREVAMTMLESHGYKVVDAGNGLEALARFKSGTEDHFDVLITDVVMPLMGGKQLAEAVLAEDPGVRVLFTSGYTSQEVVRDGLGDDSTRFLQKPYLPAVLLTQVRELIDSPANTRLPSHIS
jgi:two-component system, cell cycle sensor histidine kinase and response regulator CckA